MMRSIFAALIFLLLFAIQTSLVNSFPGAFSLIPFFLAFSVYLMQHQSLTIGAVWLSIFGFFLDFLRISDVPFETLSYTLVGVVAYTSSRRLFSNRSIYGILGCGILSFAALAASHVVMLSLSSLRSTADLVWQPVFQEMLVSAGGMVLMLLLLFQFAGNIRSILFRSFLLSRKNQTL